jgi:glycosidase
MSLDFRIPSWVHHTNIYEVNTRQYTSEGTLNAFASHLPRLKDMGVETLWFMPLQPVGKKNRKGTLGSYYSISDYISLNPEYGTFDDLELLIKNAHKLGMKVIIDWVANHTAWDHVWTRTNPDFFSKNEHGGFRPPYPDWEDVIHLNYENKDLWSAMVDDMRFWVSNFDIDGFRCDMAHLVPLDFWKYARIELDKEKKLFWLAETENIEYHEAFDASYTWEFLHAMEAYWRREKNIAGLDMVLYKYDVAFPKTAIRMYFTSNHDENSHSGTEYERMGYAAKTFAVLCATWNGIPLIYSGQELPSLQRLKFFEKDHILWSGNFDAAATGLHRFYKTLLNLHKDHPALSAGDPSVITHRVSTSANDQIFSFLRKAADREVLVILNLSANDDLYFEINDETVSGIYKDVFSCESLDLVSNKNLRMKAWDYLVCEK